MPKILLCVDLSYQVYRATAANPMLSSGNVFTGGLYGFMTTFAKTVRETRATAVVFCQDVKPYLRSKTYPEYKQLRKKKLDDELRQRFQLSMGLVVDVLIELGYEPFGVSGFESDDVIAHIAGKYRGRFDHIYAASNDSDLFQLLKYPNFSIYTKDIANCVNGTSLVKNTGLTPDQFMLMTALTGTHNDIAGIQGVGPVTAKKAVLDQSCMRVQRDKHAAVIDRNLELIKLPHAEFPYDLTLPRQPKEFNPRSLYKLLGRLDIDCTNSMVSAFEQLTE